MSRTFVIAWMITGSGDKLRETTDSMQRLVRSHEGVIEVEVFLSKAGEQVAGMYGILDKLRTTFPHVYVEQNANTPFIAGRLHRGEFVMLIVAPASSNTVAKLAHGIADTLITNGVIQALKAGVHVYVMPTDLHEGELSTTLPNGKLMKMRIRKEDAENSHVLGGMDGVKILVGADEIQTVVEGCLKVSNQ